MAIYKVSQFGSDSGTGSDLNPFKTMTKLNAMLLPGDELLVQGKVAGSLIPAASGTAAKPITIRGLDGAELNKPVNLANRKHFVLERLKLISTGGMWVNTNQGSGHNALVDVVLDSGPYVPPRDGTLGTGYPFVGLLLHGDRNRLINPTVGTWYGGDAVQMWGDYNLVQDGDWSKCRCGHGPLMVFGNYSVLQGKTRKIPVTNPWGRAFEILGKYSNGIRNLTEGIVVTDTNWNGIDPWQGHPADRDGQLFKTGGDGAIFRDIEVRRSRKPNYPYACIMHLGNYGDPAKVIIDKFKNMRFYDLLIEDNPQNAFAITHNPTMPFDCSNNRVFNSILRRNNMSFWMQQEGAWLNSFYIEDSLIADLIRRGSATMSIEQYQAKYPKLAKGNSSKTVPPKAPLTYVTASSTSDVITLGDALPLSDGNTIKDVDGDVVMVGDKLVQVREWLDNKRVRLQERVSVAAGDKVWRKHQAPVVAPAPAPVIAPVVVPVVVEPEPAPPVRVPTQGVPAPVVPEPEPSQRITIDIEGSVVSVWIDEKIVYTTVP